MNKPGPHSQSHEKPFPGRIVNVSKQRYLSREWLQREWQQVWRRT